MVLKLYIDPLSQPARALMLFCRANKLPAEEVTVSILKQEHKTPDYAKVNRFQKIPAIVHDDFQLAESVAILRYLAKAFNVPEHWYPKDIKAQSRVDEYMSWQHIGLRIPIVFYMLGLLRPERLGIRTPTPEELENYKTKMEAALNEVENNWLGRGDFIAGDQISIADLVAVGEIEMTRIINYDATNGRPKIAAYLKKVREAVGPQIYDDVHTALFKYQEMIKAKAQQL